MDSIPSSKQKGAPKGHRERKVFKVGQKVIQRQKDYFQQGHHSLVDKRVFLGGLLHQCWSWNSRLAVKITFLGKTEPAIRLDIQPWFGDRGLEQGTPFWVCGFPFRKSVSLQKLEIPNFCLLILISRNITHEWALDNKYVN